MANFKRSTTTDLSRSTRYDHVTEKRDEGVSTTSLAYDRMSARWELIDDLLGGSDRMRDAGPKWLPKNPGEARSEYTSRLMRSFLKSMYEDTLEKLVSKPFEKEAALVNADSLPERLSRIEGDVDLEGSNVSQFIRRFFYELLHRGIAHVLIEYPRVSPELNAQQERELNVHPYWVLVTAPELIAWPSKKTEGGKRKLTQIRLRTTRTISNGFGEEVQDIIRVYNAPEEGSEFVAWEIWVKDEKGKFVRTEDRGQLSFREIPLYSLQLNIKGFLEARPVLFDLAETNLEHWQSSSDQNNLLHIARVPILHTRGESEENISKPLEIGAGRAIRNTSTEADAKYVEHSGKALGAGEKHLEQLQEQAELLGMQPMLRKANSSLATALALGDSKEESELQAYARALEGFFLRLYEKSGELVGEQVPEGFGIDIFNDFGLQSRAAGEVEQLLKARQAGELSRETYLSEVQRRDLISSSIDLEEEISRIEEEEADNLSRLVPAIESQQNDEEGDSKESETLDAASA